MAEDPRDLLLATLSRAFAAYVPNRAEELLRSAELRFPPELILTVMCPRDRMPFVVRLTPDETWRKWNATSLRGEAPSEFGVASRKNLDDFRYLAAHALQFAGGDAARMLPAFWGRLADGAEFVASCPSDGSECEYLAVLADEGWRAVFLTPER